MLVIRFAIFFNNVQLAQSVEAYTKNIFESIMDKNFWLVLSDNQLPNYHKHRSWKDNFKAKMTLKYQK